jgi:hypothetical protein
LRQKKKEYSEKIRRKNRLPSLPTYPENNSKLPNEQRLAVLPSIKIEDLRTKDFEEKVRTNEIGNTYLRNSHVLIPEGSRIQNARLVVNVHSGASLDQIDGTEDPKKRKMAQALVQRPQSLNAMCKFANVLNQRLGGSNLSKETIKEIKSVIGNVDHSIRVDAKPTPSQYLSSIKMKLALMERM